MSLSIPISTTSSATIASQVTYDPQKLAIIEQQLHKADSEITDILLKLRNCDLRQIPYTESLEMRRRVDLCHTLVKGLGKDIKDISAENLQAKFNALRAKVLSAKVGGFISPQIFSSKVFKDYRQFIEVNHFDNQMLALRFQPGRNLAHRGAIVPVAQPDGTMAEISWTDLKREPIKNEQGTQTGWSFVFEGREVFRTDMDFKVPVLEYRLLHNGINKYQSRTILDLPVFDKRDPKEWGEKYVIEMWMTSRSKDGRTPSPFLGDHSFLVLKDKEGNIRSVGKLGPAAETFTSDDFKNLLGMKAGQYWTPDDYTFLPLDQNNIRVLSVETDDKSIYDRVYKHIVEQRKDPKPMFSFLKNNCTTHAADVMRDTLGVKCSTKMTIAIYVARQIFPIAWQKAFAKFYDNTFGRLPETAQNATCYFPPYYLVSLFTGLFIKCLMLYNNKGFEDKATDISWIDVFFKPWNIYIDHPITLRESIDEKYPTGQLSASLDSQGKIQLRPIPA